MKKKLPYTIIVLTICIFTICGCKNKSLQYTYYYDVNIDSIAHITNKTQQSFCIVLIDSNYSIKKYQERIENKRISPNIIWNFVNTDKKENLWYRYSIGSAKVPFTLIFTPSKQLIGVVYGISRIALQTIDETTNNHKGITHPTTFGLTENSVLNKSKNICTQIEQFIYCHSSLYAKNSADILNTIHLSQMSSSLYGNYLAATYHKQIGNKDSTQFYLDIITQKFNDMYHRIIYKNIFNEIKDVLPEQQNCVKIEFINSEQIFKKGLTDSVLIKVSNLSSINDITDLKIESSCECLEIPQNYPQIVKANQFQIYKLLFTSSDIGDIYREVYFSSKNLNMAESLDLYLKVIN
ncbi:MAG: hypothetical protein IKK07_03580 [Bacteroides sp.]|nr:hypothetical protein [Bacteroides sp.]